MATRKNAARKVSTLEEREAKLKARLETITLQKQMREIREKLKGAGKKK